MELRVRAFFKSEIDYRISDNENADADNEVCKRALARYYIF